MHKYRVRWALGSVLGAILLCLLRKDLVFNEYHSTKAFGITSCCIVGWHIKIYELSSKYKSGLLYTRLHAKVSKANIVSRVCNLCYRTILHCKTEHNSDTYLKTYTVATQVTTKISFFL